MLEDLTNNQKAAFYLSIILAALILDLIVVRSVRKWREFIRKNMTLMAKFYGVGKFEHSKYHIALYGVYFGIAVSIAILICL